MLTIFRRPSWEAVRSTLLYSFFFFVILYMRNVASLPYAIGFAIAFFLFVLFVFEPLIDLSLDYWVRQKNPYRKTK